MACSDRNQTRQEYSPAPIAKCHTPTVLESEDGTILLIDGTHKVSASHRNGYSTKVCTSYFLFHVSGTN